MITFGFIYGLVTSTKQNWYPPSGPLINSLIELLEIHIQGSKLKKSSGRLLATN